jgi:predicted peroxiredoxin
MTFPMYNADTELLFPPRIIASLRTLRGATWKKMVDQVETSGDSSPEKIGFVLMMVKINGCTSCNADSFRAMQGCTQCSKQTIRRLKEPDRSLVKLFNSSKQEVVEYQSKDPKKQIIQDTHDKKTNAHKRSYSRRSK